MRRSIARAASIASMLCVFVASLASVPGGLAAGQHAVQLSPHGNGLIAFSSARSGNQEIYAMSQNGSGQIDLSNDTSSDTLPAWSPDGERIAFVTDRTGNNEIFVMNADGSGQLDLSNRAATDTQPAWSPDGAKIAFVSGRTGNNEIFVMNADGSSQTNLSNTAASDTEPAFSPDQGSHVVFTTKRAGSNEIYVMDSLDGSDQVDLSHNPASDTSPDWQPLAASPPNGSPIQHVVIIDMENHTFDNVLGKLCASTGRCDGATTGKIKDGSIIALGAATDIVPVVQHEPVAQRTAIDGGLMDGFSLISG
jgi:hypothetical protein